MSRCLSEISPDYRPVVRESRRKPLRVRPDALLTTLCVRNELIAELCCHSSETLPPVCFYWRFHWRWAQFPSRKLQRQNATAASGRLDKGDSSKASISNSPCAGDLKQQGRSKRGPTISQSNRPTRSLCRGRAIHLGASGGPFQTSRKESSRREDCWRVAAHSSGCARASLISCERT